MKARLAILTAAAATFLFFNRAGAQAWEGFYPDANYDPNSPISVYFVSPGPNNEVRLHKQTYDNAGGDLLTTTTLDENGELVTNATAFTPGVDWSYFMVDKEGASYWSSQSGYKVRKYDAANQFVWNYVPPVSAGILWEQAGVDNGSFFLRYSPNGQSGLKQHQMSLDAQLVNTFKEASDFGDFMATRDGGIIYSNFNNNDLTKLDAAGQVMWQKTTLTDYPEAVESTPDGGTYLTSWNNDTLLRLGPVGNQLWMISDWETFMQPYFAGWVYAHTYLTLSDGSLLVISDGNSLTADYLLLTKIDGATGAHIWTTEHQLPEDMYVNTYPYYHPWELPDGGLLCGFDASDGQGQQGHYVIRANSSGQANTNLLTGQFFRDNDGDCQPQSSEPPIAGATLIAKSGARMFSGTAGADGKFSIPISGGSYTLSVGQLGSYWDLCDLPGPLAIAAQNDTVQLDIGAKAIVDCPQLSVSVASIGFRRCFDNHLYISYKNTGTAEAQNAHVDVTLDPKLLYLSSTIPLAAQNGQVFQFNLGNLAVGASGSFNITMQVDCDATLGEMLCASAHIFPDTNCTPTAAKLAENPFCLPVVASFDPNDKTAFVNGQPNAPAVEPDKPLEYLIRFQNTGTDTAFNITVLDTLPSSLDAASVLPGAASHPYEFSLVDGRVLRFVFKNILLPDSLLNQAGSHGFVKFSVRQKTGNALGLKIENRAAIFFDFNAAVLTNSAVTTVLLPVRVLEATPAPSAKVWPQPAVERVEVLLENTGGQAVDWQMSDALGLLVRSGEASSERFVIERNGLGSGVYFLQIMGKNGSRAAAKLVFD